MTAAAPAAPTSPSRALFAALADKDMAAAFANADPSERPTLVAISRTFRDHSGAVALAKLQREANNPHQPPMVRALVAAALPWAKAQSGVSGRRANGTVPRARRKDGRPEHAASTDSSDQSERAKPVTDRSDHEDDAVLPMRSRCIALGCGLEPSRADQQRGDGLCQECRELSRPGLDVRTTATRAQKLQTWCRYIAANYPRALPTLRALYKTAQSQADKNIIADEGRRLTPEEEPAAETPCQTCGLHRSTRDTQQGDNGQCRRCHTLENAPVSSGVLHARA